MTYGGVVPAEFLSRLNRFIARVRLGENIETVHVKNTGRCRELLVPGARVYLEPAQNPARRTKYDLIAVQKGGRLINMDAAAPNRVFYEYLAAGRLYPDPTLIRPETVFGGSRLDFYLEAGDRRAFLEVKGVTLEEDGIARFPDAPTERGVRHLHELVRCVQAGFDAWAVFIVQMAQVTRFEPNRATHPEFADTLRLAAEAGVRLLALECDVTPGSLEARREVEVCLI